MGLYLSLIMMQFGVVIRLGKTTLSDERKKNIIKENIGRIIIFCEGPTEKYYLDYFANIINKSKYTDVHIETESANGNAKTVLNFAEKFLSQEENNRKYVNYGKSLIFDCDAPKNIQNVINEMQASDKKFTLLVSNYLFELWLLMHFEIVDKKLTKRKIYEKLSGHLVNDYIKADSGVIREIIANGSVEDAIKNAFNLVQLYESDGKTIEKNIIEMNPYTNVYKLIEQFMMEIS